MSLPDERAVRAWLQAATWAPSIHNTQPWLFRVTADAVEVHADMTRRLPAIDASGRAMHLSLGAATANLRVAMRHSGHAATVALLPDPSHPLHVASVRPDGDRPADDADRELYAAIARRRSNRGPFDGRVPPAADLAALQAAALAEGATLEFADDVQRRTLLDVARTSDGRMTENTAYRDELRRWTTDDPYRDDGVSIEAVGPRSAHATLPLRDFAADREIPGRLTVEFEREPTLATLWTAADTPRDRLLAGIALQRVLLEATCRGIETCLFTQPPADLRRLVRRGGPTAQAIVRLGYGKEAPRSNRRPLDEVRLPS
ncbi:Acg family FMN-binding oxidoreductase [Sphaerisporangium dianthi]|uniref:Acg family FMN-binding oxidoreductase n=1 Tax=Sphaerisporangium dianthi TaxID=1436120 RepID=A0ABV9CWU6_9ACTN